MEPRTEEITRLLDSVDRLTRLAEGSEQRMRRLERWNRSLVGSLFALVGLGLYVGVGLSGPSAVAAEGEVARVEQSLAGDAKRLESDADQMAATAKFDAEADAQRIDAKMAAIRHDVASGKSIDPLKGIMAMLHEVQKALQAMPRMADDMDQMTLAMNQMNAKMSAMPAMAVDMHEMNGKMGIMAHDVNRTMGKMGSWMPMPWGP
ncbi:hypothetical protein [Endothiovibrio diazotrophicus]